MGEGTCIIICRSCGHFDPRNPVRASSPVGKGKPTECQLGYFNTVRSCCGSFVNREVISMVTCAICKTDHICLSELMFHLENVHHLSYDKYWNEHVNVITNHVHIRKKYKPLTEGSTRGCKKKYSDSPGPGSPPPPPRPKHHSGGGCSQGSVGTAVYKRDILTVLDLFDLLLHEVKSGRGEDEIFGLYGANDSKCCFCIEAAEPSCPDPKEDGDSQFLLHLGLINRP